MSDQLITPVAFSPGEGVPGAHLLGGWFSHKNDLDCWELNHDSSVVWPVAYLFFMNKYLKTSASF
jgi:hypothetical protein